MKKIALISSYCDTEDKLNILKKNISILKNIGVDIMVLSPITIDNSIVSLCDFFIHTKENPILRWPIRAHTFWLNFKNKFGDNLFLHRDIDDYSWANLYQIKKLSEIALTYDYDIFYHMIYDLNIDNDIIAEINQNVINKTYHRINPKDENEVWNVTLHFLSLDRNNIKYFSDNILYQDYVTKTGFAEQYVESILSELNLNKSEFSVKDVIRHIDSDDEDMFNYSKNKNYKIFFSKVDDKYYFIIYNCDDNYVNKITLNDNKNLEYDYEKPITFETEKLLSFKVTTIDGYEEYSEILNTITRNVIEIKN
jgi:hypothetical protein